jgi:hypothetical protein
METLKKFPKDSKKWGLFSRNIPGRVGYQCSNFYRLLVKRGEIIDTNYEVNDGKIHHINKDGSLRDESKKRKKNEECETPKKKKKKLELVDSNE